MTVTIQRLAEPQIEASGKVLSRAFFDDPVSVHILPDDADRAPRLGWFMALGVLYGHRWGEVYTTGTDVVGNAVWLPPGETDVNEERMMQIGLGDGPERLGPEAFARLLEFLAFCQPLHKEAMPRPHWYLMLLGVDPPMQGRGVGGRLIRPVLERADRDGLGCYLETAKERNVTFYRKHGFDVVVDTRLPGGPRIWTMRRQPARRA
jgi:GNAT superfamily N-acetyltransferase